MTAERIDQAVARIIQRDEVLGKAAGRAAEFLTWGMGVDVITQAELQTNLWWRLPKKWPDDMWETIVAGAAALFDELELPRYAAIARSSDTMKILDGWRGYSNDGHELAMAARQRSGVAAPDTDLFEWSAIFGTDEAAALELVERALEKAIVAGSLLPRRRGWKQAAIDITNSVLSTPQEELLGQTPLTSMITERLSTWISTARVPEHQQLRKAIANRLLTPIPEPEDVGPLVEKFRWLLELAAPGVQLTQSGYLPPRLVAEAAERLDWDFPFGVPRSEADFYPLLQFRQSVMSQRLLKKAGRILSVTTKGSKAIESTAALWAVVVGSLGGDSQIEQNTSELLLLLLLNGPIVSGELAAEILPILMGQGWRAGDDELEAGHVSPLVQERRQWWRTNGVLIHEPAQWDPSSRQQISPGFDRLSDVGVSAALTYLRGLATGPRSNFNT